MNYNAVGDKVLNRVETVIDDEIDRLDNLLSDTSELERLRAARIKQLKEKQKKSIEYVQKGHGTYSEIVDEMQFFKTIENSDRIICHFYKSGTFRCEILDKHFSILAEKHVETKFIKLNVEKFTNISVRLGVSVIPTMICFKGEQILRRLIGFEAFGSIDDFSTKTAEEYFISIGIIDID